MLHTQLLTRRVVAAKPLNSVAVSRTNHKGFTHRHACISRVSSSGTPDSITDEEAERFEKIAAALVEKLKDLPDTEVEPEGEFCSGLPINFAKQRGGHSTSAAQLCGSC